MPRLISVRWLIFLFLLFLGAGHLLWPPSSSPSEPPSPPPILAGTVIASSSSLPPPAPSVPVAPAADRWTLVAVGDIMLSRYVATLASRSPDPAFPFGDVRDLISGADLAFANLENPVAEGKPVVGRGLIFRMNPELVPRLASAGFDVLSIANNHMTDAGLAGVGSTHAFLAAAGLAVAGAGETEAAARAPALLTVGDQTVAFLAYADPRFYKQVRFATDHSAGVAKADEAAIATDIAAARALADVVIVSLHAGTEYRDAPDTTQERLVQAAAAAGADLVLGHHPHVLQPLRWESGVPVAYSLGNFVFDQEGVQQNLGVALRVIFAGRHVVGVEAIPIQIVGSAPRAASGALAAMAVRRLDLQTFQVGFPSTSQ